MVTENTIEKVQRLLVSCEGGEDKLRRPYTQNGQYTVKTGYHLQKQAAEKKTKKRLSSSHQVDKMIWKAVWRLKVPEKVKSFLWRAYANTVATNQNLWKKKVKGVVWFGMDVSYKIDKQRISTLDEWLKAVMCYSKADSDEQTTVKIMVSLICWNIWKERCNVVYQKEKPKPDVVIRRKKKAIAECMSIWEEAK
ncbi:putative ribonuclease H protein [Corchorus olitorius]|uniref:Ribonuclease H protein n=1 Tax=Corchorus olitorius TaxID=93759 RepID=A0A1R3GHQ1_9ROSI|nr:putative ribonuclease H protein [Corchorus olitorius]